MNDMGKGMVRLSRAIWLLVCLLATPQLLAAPLTVAAAADLKFVMKEIVSIYERRHPQTKIDVVTGSSGKFYEQIVNGAPFDLYFSADIEYPKKLRSAGAAASDVQSYAIGRLVLWSIKFPVTGGVAELSKPQFQKVSIANPSHAPYGKRAKEILFYYVMAEKVEPKLVFGESVSQAAQYVETGAADAAIIPIALVLAPEMKGKGTYYAIDDRAHSKMEQGFVILKRAEKNAEALDFARYVISPEARAIFVRYGFQLPGEGSE